MWQLTLWAHMRQWGLTAMCQANSRPLPPTSWTLPNGDLLVQLLKNQAKQKQLRQVKQTNQKQLDLVNPHMKKQLILVNTLLCLHKKNQLDQVNLLQCQSTIGQLLIH